MRQTHRWRMRSLDWSRVRWLFACFAVVGAFGLQNARAQGTSAKTEKTKKIKIDGEIQLVLGAQWKSEHKKIRLRDLSTGEEHLLELSDPQPGQQLDAAWVKPFRDRGLSEIVLHVSVLDLKRLRRLPVIEGTSDSPYARSLFFDQPTWVRAPIRVHEGRSKTRLIIGDGAPDIVRKQKPGLDAERAAARRKLREQRDVQKLFEQAWGYYTQGQFAEANEVFSELLRKRNSLDETQLRQTELGMGVSTYHVEGCSAAEPFLKRADRDINNRDDVSFYRGVCLIQSEKYGDSEKLFSDLLIKQHPFYGDQSRFYLGLIHEMTNRFESSRTYYLDTIDFATDPRLVELAKERLQLTERKEQEYNYKKAWFNGSLTSLLGYDSNVASLPGSASPADLNLSGKSGLSTTNVALLEVKPPWSSHFENRNRYQFLWVHYLKEDLSSLYDVSGHEVGGNVSFQWYPRNKILLDGMYNAILLGPLTSARDYSRNIKFKLNWTRLSGDLKAPQGEWTFGVEGSDANVLLPPADSADDANGIGASADFGYTWLSSSPHIYFLGTKFGYQMLEGADAKNMNAKFTGRWDSPLWEEQEIFMSHEGSVQWVSYPDSSASRRDWIFAVTATISKPVLSWLTSAFQLSLTQSSSSDAQYQYFKFQSNFVLSAVF